MEHHADYTLFDADVSREDALGSLILSYDALATSQSNWVTNLANCSSLLYHCYESLDVNWAGFYVVDPKNTEQLILGPFMGKVACQSIRIGTGVCGTAAASMVTQIVPDVDAFPGHIACDGDTRSEIVVPIVQNGKVVAVMDLDCTELDGFNEDDQLYLEQLADMISYTCDF
jgi:L-methionine (R)-S-oxide reductase